MLWLREEAEYDVEEGENYKAAPINRFRTSWYEIHLLSSFWRVTETTSSVHTFMKTPGAYGYASKCAHITPKMLEDTLLSKYQNTQNKPSVQSILADKDLPTALRTALTSLHQATASLVGSDGHRKLLQREGVAYTLRYGPALIFTTPNIADTKQPLLLIVQGEPFQFDSGVGASYREMTERLAADPVGQAIVFEFMMQLFFTRVLGIRAELIGWRRGSIGKPSKKWNCHGTAADFCSPWLFGPIAAAFGPVEAQGRGSLHPHILIWLLLTEISDLLVWMLRDRSRFQERLNQWMQELIASVVSVQESAVELLPQTMQPADPGSNPDLVPPLPFGPSERARYHANGGNETVTTAELGWAYQENSTEQDLYYQCHTKTGDEEWLVATRPELPLRNNAGEEVTEEAWKAEFEETNGSVWTKKITEWASGTFPAYRLGYREHAEGLSQGNARSSGSVDALVREAVPCDEFIREMCRDARGLVIGCSVHLCCPSCWKYHSKGKYQICRHHYYHVVDFFTEDSTEVRRRRKGKPLRACLAIVRETQYGMAGRIITFQLHPWECPTAYAGLVSLRCNLDVQDLRRTLPPHMWMPSENLEPDDTEHPQRLRGLITFYVFLLISYDMLTDSPFCFFFPSTCIVEVSLSVPKSIGVGLSI